MFKMNTDLLVLGAILLLLHNARRKGRADIRKRHAEQKRHGNRGHDCAHVEFAIERQRRIHKRERTAQTGGSVQSLRAGGAVRQTKRGAQSFAEK